MGSEPPPYQVKCMGGTRHTRMSESRHMCGTQVEGADGWQIVRIVYIVFQYVGWQIVQIVYIVDGVATVSRID